MSKARDLADLLKASGDVKTEHLDEAAKKDMSNVESSASIPPTVQAMVDQVQADLETISYAGL
jgi:hypothetical protein